ncbi:MAG: ATP-binding protein [Sciscionella sp.]|nr:ATP-binding protein [Sciscionella sp.]
MSEEELSIIAGQAGDLLIATPVGRLTAATHRAFRDELLALAGKATSALVIDLSRLRAELPTQLSVFVTVSLRIADWPGIPMALANVHRGLAHQLAQSSVGKFLPIYRSVDDAIAAFRARPAEPIAQLSLANDPTSDAVARTFIRQLCDRWRLTDLVDDAALLASELVANVVAHTSTRCTLRVKLADSALQIAVHDDEPRPPRLHHPEPLASGGRGLVLVDALATSWGITPTASGGKVVWATLSTSTTPTAAPAGRTV